MTGDNERLCVAVCTGSRAEFGLLEPIMWAVDAHEALTLRVIVAGAHLLPPAQTWRDVETTFPLAAQIPMQRAGATSRLEDAAALGRGVAGFARTFEEIQPDWVVVLGDRIEALAAACAASVGGLAVAHLHGGDRAEGVADEAMRHAITKLAHLHLPATEQSAQRICQMGEEASRVHVVGSPAIDALAGVEPLGDDAWRDMGSPDTVFLMHPVGREREEEQRDADAAFDALASIGLRIIALHPNNDPGREGVMDAIASAGVNTLAHLQRSTFLALLKRLTTTQGFILGNSSAGLIECAAIGLPAVDIGPRQSGRERAGNVVHVDLACEQNGEARKQAIVQAITAARELHPDASAHPFGDGCTGPRVAALLAQAGKPDWRFLRKQNTY